MPRHLAPFASMDYDGLGLEGGILHYLKTKLNHLEVDLTEETSAKRAFQTLIDELYERNGPVVIRVDVMCSPSYENL